MSANDDNVENSANDNSNAENAANAANDTSSASRSYILSSGSNLSKTSVGGRVTGEVDNAYSQVTGLATNTTDKGVTALVELPPPTSDFRATFVYTMYKKYNYIHTKDLFINYKSVYMQLNVVLKFILFVLVISSILMIISSLVKFEEHHWREFGKVIGIFAITLWMARYLDVL